MIKGYVVVPLSNSFVLPDEIGLAVLASRRHLIRDRAEIANTVDMPFRSRDDR
jgi:hypothetical protein